MLCCLFLGVFFKGGPGHAFSCPLKNPFRIFARCGSFMHLHLGLKAEAPLGILTIVNYCQTIDGYEWISRGFNQLSWEISWDTMDVFFAHVDLVSGFVCSLLFMPMDDDPN